MAVIERLGGCCHGDHIFFCFLIVLESYVGVRRKRESKKRNYHRNRGSLITVSNSIDKDWKGFTAEQIQAASKSAYEEAAEMADREMAARRGLNMEGYQSIRGEFFPSISAPSMTITSGRMRFNTACLKKFEDVEYVELLINTVTNSIAIRPCEKDNPNAIHWGTLRESRWCVNEFGIKGFASILFGMMSWEDDTRYKFRGQYTEKDGAKMLLFELDEPQMIKTVEQVVPVVTDELEDGSQVGDEDANAAQEEIVVTEKVRILPSSWATSFGRPITSLSTVSLLERVQLDGDWDVLRPARELEELNTLTAEERANLLHEAEDIIDGWAQKLAEEADAESKDDADAPADNPTVDMDEAEEIEEKDEGDCN